MIGAASVYDMANQFDLYDNGGLDVCFMGALEVDKYGNINAHRAQEHLRVLAVLPISPPKLRQLFSV